MPLYDKPLDELVAYNPPLTKQPDFDAFWDRTLSECCSVPVDAEIRQVDYPAIGVQVSEVNYTGWRGGRVCAWYLRPQGEGPFPALIQYHGYGGWKRGVHNYLSWALQGYIVLAVDVRGQPGNSSNPGPYSGGHVAGWMTQGVLDPEEYYYRGVYMDCVRAVDLAGDLPGVDRQRIGVMGGSQGGALTLAVSALDQRVALAMPQLPYLCHFRRAVDMAARGPYLEFATYLRNYPSREEQVFRTLSYYDNLNLASRIRCPVLMSVGLQDDICPPSTVYAVYNQITAPKEMRVYPYHNHEEVDAHAEVMLRWAHHYLQGMNTL